MISEARKFQYVDVQGVFLYIFFIESCKMSLQAHFSVVADTKMYVPCYNKLSAKKSIAATNNRTTNH